jgi:hypothetical protein
MREKLHVVCGFCTCMGMSAEWNLTGVMARPRLRHLLSLLKAIAADRREARFEEADSCTRSKEGRRGGRTGSASKRAGVGYFRRRRIVGIG